MARSLVQSSILLGLAAISLTATILLLLAAIVLEDWSYSKTAGITLGLALLTWLLSLTIGSRCRCQLCQAPMMMPRKCSKHRKAETFFGSYRLKLSSSILFAQSFLCPFCGERFTSRVRVNPRYADVSKDANARGLASPTRKTRKVSLSDSHPRRQRK
ncbi:MAG: hypothetical protein ACSHYF_08945 [Verrucomicrobiaceae bacterium]